MIKKCICNHHPIFTNGLISCFNPKCGRKPSVTRVNLEVATEAWNNLIEIILLKDKNEELECQVESLRLDIEHGTDRVC